MVSESLLECEMRIMKLTPTPFFQCGPSLAAMDLAGSPAAVKKRVLG